MPENHCLNIKAEVGTGTQRKSRVIATLDRNTPPAARINRRRRRIQKDLFFDLRIAMAVFPAGSSITHQARRDQQAGKKRRTIRPLDRIDQRNPEF
ncbi:hypothetical protein DESC_830007 [Desulfosarcina cetonica]|nr:hypothetical protein DESC_830007 [Desulfosarcina cetonica]